MNQLEKTWAVARLRSGAYCVYRPEAGGLAYYAERGVRSEFDHAAGAEILRDLLNGRPSLPRACDANSFERLTGHITLRPPTRGALRAILVEGRTWKQAAAHHGVSESGILKALRRVATLNHP